MLRSRPSTDTPHSTSTENHPLLDAIASAVTQAESVTGIRVARVEGEELVSRADIAERTGRSRQAVNHRIKRDAWLEPGGHTGDRGRIIALVNATLLARHNLFDDQERKLVRMLLTASEPIVGFDATGSHR